MPRGARAVAEGTATEGAEPAPAPCAHCPAVAVGLARRESEFLAEALDHVAEAVALVDASGQIVRANRCAMELLRKSGALALSRDQHLLVRHPAARVSLSRVLVRFAQAPQPRGREPERLTVPRARGRPLVLTLHPLRARPPAARGPIAIMLIGDPDGKLESGDALIFAFGLSPAEMRVVQALSEGASLREIATSSELSYETVRSYLKRVLSKTGARGQADLVRLSRTLR